MASASGVCESACVTPEFRLPVGSPAKVGTGTDPGAVVGARGTVVESSASVGQGDGTGQRFQDRRRNGGCSRSSCFAFLSCSHLLWTTNDCLLSDVTSVNSTLLPFRSSIGLTRADPGKQLSTPHVFTVNSAVEPVPHKCQLGQLFTTQRETVFIVMRSLHLRTCGRTTWQYDVDVRLLKRHCHATERFCAENGVTRSVCESNPYRVLSLCCGIDLGLDRVGVSLLLASPVASSARPPQKSPFFFAANPTSTHQC